jgi:GT2 family glycosyltransferase
MTLPNPLSLDVIEAHTPGIPPVPTGRTRPFWSVIIPTYNNRGDHLRRSLESVLDQYAGADAMQIEVVDGGSTTFEAEEIVKRFGRGVVGFERLPANRGPSHTFNVCIERSRGHWLHILHGDDMVAHGFYDAYAAVARAHPDARMVVGQVVSIDEADRWTKVSDPTPPIGGGILPDFARAQATRQQVQFPSVVVRRDAYETVGGFCTLFNHVCDWDMWFRVSTLAPVACVGRPYAFYRTHNGSDTNRQRVSAANVLETYFVVMANLARLKGELPADPSWRSTLAEMAEATAWMLDYRHCPEGRLNQTRWAWMLEPNAHRLVMLLKSWVKCRWAMRADKARPAGASAGPSAGPSEASTGTTAHA